MADQTIVEVKGVHRAFGQGERRVHVLRGVDLNVHEGELIALYGPSGSGKTTLLNLIGTLDTPTSGEIIVNGTNINHLRERGRAKLRRQQLGFIFQTYTLISTYTALENIDLALRLPKVGFFERRRRATTALAAVGLTAWTDHKPDELSGGQRQRVAIARALALQPKLILADEPTSGLDTRTSRRILTLFKRIAQEHGTAFIIVSHDPVVVDFVDAAYDLHDGQVVLREQLPAISSAPLNGQKPLQLQEAQITPEIVI